MSLRYTPVVRKRIAYRYWKKVRGLSVVGILRLAIPPERINPGDKERTVTKILKIVSGGDEESLETIADVY